MSFDLTRSEFISGLIALPILASPAAGARSHVSAGAETRTARVPFDHWRPSDGAFSLEYYIAGPFRPDWPSVFVIGDGQQFYIRPDLWGEWRDRFGPQANVVGIAGRGFAEGLQKRVGAPSGEAWIEAYRLLRYEQWTADIDLVRRELHGLEGRIRVYGVSGGGRLVHEYLSGYGQHASAALTRAAVFSYLNGEFNLQNDRFWDEISDEDRRQLTRVLRDHPDRREDYAQLFQRQNFFVQPDELARARSQLVSDLVAQRNDVIAKLRHGYQIDDINELLESPAGAAIHVRLFEFFAPVASSFKPNDPIFRPDAENTELMARPLLEHWRAGRIPTPAIDLRALHAAPTEVVMIAGRYDHTCDYRSQIALASCYPNHRLFIVDDDHMFKRMAAVDGLNRRLFAAWRQGTGAPAFKSVMAELTPLIWRET